MNLSRFMTLFIAFILIPQLAFASHAKELDSAIDSYFYSMTVEWDQVNESFAKKQNDILSEKINTLVKDGLTAEELKAAFNKTSGLDFNQFENEVGTIDSTNTEKIKNLIVEKLASRYDKGASWEGVGEMVGYVLVLGLIATIVFGVSRNIARCVNGTGNC